MIKSFYEEPIFSSDFQREDLQVIDKSIQQLLDKNNGVGVVRGQSVSTGDPLGTAGMSHSLIYELRIGSKSTDPQLALNGSSGLQFREAE